VARANNASDFATVDDQAPVPTSFDIARDVPAITEDQVKDDQETNNEAAPFWHPAWASVQRKFEELLEAYDGNNILQFKDLPIDEFKVRVLANQTVREEIKKIMEDVQNAVEAIEQQPNRPKQPNSSDTGS